MKSSGTYNEFIRDLDMDLSAAGDWRPYEEVVTDIIIKLFMPPLSNPKIQKPRVSGTSRPDLILSNRNFEPGNSPAEKNWYYLGKELDAKLIVFEIKNYGKLEIGPED